MRPTGRSRTLMRAGAIGDIGSTAIATLGMYSARRPKWLCDIEATELS
jgi:hypothetical protein